jgi:methylated-DNA-[protein]-cysteine S-methyltransferase
MRKLYYRHMDSPIGGLGLLVDEKGRVVRVAFLKGEAARPLLEYLHPGATLVEDQERTRELARQLEQYFSGERLTFELELEPEGSELQKEVWRELLAIPRGETRSYGQIAKKIGRPGAARAVGRANATNPIPVIVPCHRVIGSDGSLTGFGGGLPMKKELLRREGVEVQDELDFG